MTLPPIISFWPQTSYFPPLSICLMVLNTPNQSRLIPLLKIYYFFSEARFYSVAQAGLKLTILQSQPPSAEVTGMNYHQNP